jgi:hypothetical protein
LALKLDVFLLYCEDHFFNQTPLRVLADVVLVPQQISCLNIKTHSPNLFAWALVMSANLSFLHLKP